MAVDRFAESGRSSNIRNNRYFVTANEPIETLLRIPTDEFAVR